MLLGRKSTWTNWSTRRITSYTNLLEGEYVFLLRSKNIYGEISETTEYRFVIRPPWWRTILAFIVYSALLILLIYVAVRLGQRRLKKKNERLEAIIRARTKEIWQQNVKLAAQKKEITDSIYYAERIQRAILPHTERIAAKINDYFILFKPKDIVSGDFYWLAENGRKIIITAVDCTGHGVPGAFMSMLGISFLNKIILEDNTLQADRILNELRDDVVSSLKQTGKEGEARDGMDMALVAIDLQKMTMEFAGANNPLYMIRENELTETKADRMPIAYHADSNKFSNHLIQLNKGDLIYLFSDGYADQFGGPRGKKFKYKLFKNLLIENRDKPMREIKEILVNTIENWKAPDGPDAQIYEQVDDILVIGLRI
jgi:serine phosphatase RsbU (regulator of sigma subunit)